MDQELDPTRVLAGYAALVTGGGGGLGSAIAARLVRDGASVTIMGRTESSLQEVCESIRADVGDRAAVQYVVGDAFAADDVSAAVKASEAGGAALRICVPVVGGGSMHPVLAFDRDTFLADLERNTVASFLAVKYATPLMVEAGGGSIVCISSDAASLPFPYMAGYCAGKAALDAFVRVAALELGHLGVRVNTVRPGLVRTNSENSRALFARPDIIDRFVVEKPLGRTGVPDDVANVVRFLAGPESSWVTGQNWGVEGGNELTKAPSMEPLVRERVGDAAFDAATSGRLPEST